MKSGPGKVLLMITFGFCLVWVIAVPVAYMLTLDDDIATRFWGNSGPSRTGMIVFTIYVLAQFTFIPLCLVLGLLVARPLIRRSDLYGAICGVVLAFWLSTLMLALPYVGTYPNILGALVGSIMSGGSNMGPSYYMGVILTNIVIWPLILAIVGGMIERMSNSSRKNSCTHSPS